MYDSNMQVYVDSFMPPTLIGVMTIAVQKKNYDLAAR